jgi:hypothetical protein
MNPTEINWRSVDSSNIDAIALHDDHLCVRFTSGAVYRYQAAEGGELATRSWHRPTKTPTSQSARSSTR